MVQYLNEFSNFCRNVGLLAQKEQFKMQKSTLEETLLMHLITLNREQMIELSARIVRIWNNNNGDQKQESPLESQQRKMSVSEIHTKSSSQLNHLYEQHILNEENQIVKRDQQINHLMKECTFKPQITKKSQKLELSSPAHIRLNNYAMDSKIKLQIVQELNQKQELKDCTFKPSINTKSIGNNQSVENPFDRLYQNALSQRNKTPRNFEDSSFTYRPQLISTPMRLQQQEGISVEERLYNHHFEKMNNMVLKQEELQQIELDQCTFAPAINQQSNCRQNEKVFERLYNHSSVKSVSEVKDNSISHMNKKSESLIKKPQSDNNSYVTQFQLESNPFDRLYQEHQRQEKKKKSNQIQYYQSIPFKPILSKKLSLQ
ncbi:unnamed protein product (macronuclear) [Paramecium tetraurelia]|uniref:Uncharacterized protein n=1 Tax=Paramecium tetraurelia TaxID=5888 RepID=A0CUB3_PARTE|nr:uncharacterized protein GSPATT00010580001 [Paramecium tetraurelia]CAK74380.1 unnamed protein product [Paramecium tetraurelia]|eukprot:XP_001441777.1 hypothetical protein (macronuclear) [Paramecium tetraurelia strain d4-2]